MLLYFHSVLILDKFEIIGHQITEEHYDPELGPMPAEGMLPPGPYSDWKDFGEGFFGPGALQLCRSAVLW